jgi:hypothetical protein
LWLFEKEENDMITTKNALIEALAQLQVQPLGHKVTMPARIQHRVENLDEWAAKRGVQYTLDSRYLSIWRVA